MTDYIITDQMREWGRANGYNVDLHHEFFMDYIANKTGKPYKDLDAAFRNCVRADWGGLRKAQRFTTPQHVAPNQIVRANTFIPLPKETVVAMPETFRKLVRRV